MNDSFLGGGEEVVTWRRRLVGGFGFEKMGVAS